MCAVSAISDYYMSPSSLTYPSFPNPPTFDNETKALLREIVSKLDAIDKRLGDKECMDDKKKEFFDAIEYKGE